MLRGFVQEFGRDPATFGIEAWVRAARFDPDAWAADVAAWKRLGAGIAMLYLTYDQPDFASQIDLLQRFKCVVETVAEWRGRSGTRRQLPNRRRSTKLPTAP